MKIYSALSFATAFGVCISAAAWPSAQTPAADNPQATFEVASVKVNKTGADGASIRVQPGGRMTATNQTVRNLIRNAYNIQPYQFVGGPNWIDDDRFDIIAKMADADIPESGMVRPEQMMLRLQSLLADRFKLVVRRETREVPIFALVMARADRKFGPRLRVAEGECAERARAGDAPPPGTPSGDRPCGIRFTRGKVIAGATLMEALARNMSGLVQRVIVDRTGLTDRYDLDLDWSPDSAFAPGASADRPAADASGSSLFTALEEQLGLKLEATRGPVEALVIESVERPLPD
jgi:uncharacterized protein (TIGR03435 family)